MKISTYLLGKLTYWKSAFISNAGLFDADVIPELSYYESDPWVRYKWDTLQSKFAALNIPTLFSAHDPVILSALMA